VKGRKGWKRVEEMTREEEGVPEQGGYRRLCGSAPQTALTSKIPFNLYSNSFSKTDQLLFSPTHIFKDQKTKI
jgi:hypothetical protein